MIETTINSSTLELLLRSHALAIGTVERKVQASVTKEALNLKRDWRQEASGHRNLPHLPGAVEVTEVAGGKAVSFGDRAQGQIAHIGTFGAPKTAPFMNPFRYVPEAALRLARFVGEIGADV